MSGLIGKKIGMTSLYDVNGKNIPCTVIEAGPCVVTQVRTKDIDGYEALQLGFDDKSEKNSSNAAIGHFKKANTSVKRKLVEFKNFSEDHKLGDLINVEHFIEGEFVDVSGISKGKGFAGTVKRHNFKGGPKTHGQSDRHRAPGSIGAGSSPGRVWKGTKMSGHMGSERVTQKGLRIVKVDAKDNILEVQGSVPGSVKSMIMIEKNS